MQFEPQADTSTYTDTGTCPCTYAASGRKTPAPHLAFNHVTGDPRLLTRSLSDSWRSGASEHTKVSPRRESTCIPDHTPSATSHLHGRRVSSRLTVDFATASWLSQVPVHRQGTDNYSQRQRRRPEPLHSLPPSPADVWMRRDSATSLMDRVAAFVQVASHALALLHHIEHTAFAWKVWWTNAT